MRLPVDYESHKRVTSPSSYNKQESRYNPPKVAKSFVPVSVAPPKTSFGTKTTEKKSLSPSRSFPSSPTSASPNSRRDQIFENVKQKRRSKREQLQKEQAKSKSQDIRTLANPWPSDTCNNFEFSNVSNALEEIQSTANEFVEDHKRMSLEEFQSNASEFVGDHARMLNSAVNKIAIPSSKSLLDEEEENGEGSTDSLHNDWITKVSCFQ